MQIITTGDGSHTIFSEKFQDSYHSRHGALQESEYVFIRNGFEYYLNHRHITTENNPILIFEVGFGTGLNALLTMLEADNKMVQVDYTTIELYPLPIETIKALNYTEVLGYEFCYGPYHTLHLCRWNETHEVTSWFRFNKIQKSILDYDSLSEAVEIIFFDAFSPDAQPELWTLQVIEKMFQLLKSGGVLVSYCSKSSFQKILKSAGFRIEKLSGPPGKREILRAHKD